MTEVIRVNGQHQGRRVIVLIIPPDKVKRMRAGHPVSVDVQRGHPDIVTAPLEVIIHAPTQKGVEKLAASIAGEAKAQGIRPKKVRGKQ